MSIEPAESSTSPSIPLDDNQKAAAALRLDRLKRVRAARALAIWEKAVVPITVAGLGIVGYYLTARIPNATEIAKQVAATNIETRRLDLQAASDEKNRNRATLSDSEQLKLKWADLATKFLLTLDPKVKANRERLEWARKIISIHSGVSMSKEVAASFYKDPSDLDSPLIKSDPARAEIIHARQNLAVYLLSPDTTTSVRLSKARDALDRALKIFDEQNGFMSFIIDAPSWLEEPVTVVFTTEKGDNGSERLDKKVIGVLAPGAPLQAQVKQATYQVDLISIKTKKILAQGILRQSDKSEIAKVTHWTRP